MSIETLTLTLALLVAIITFGQWSTARQNLKQQLFDKRYEVYEKITAFLAEILTTGKVQPGSDIQFLRETKRAYFLFSGDENIKELISKIYSKSVNLHALDAELSSIEGEERSENIKKQRVLKEWVEYTLKNMEVSFAKYLKLKH